MWKTRIPYRLIDFSSRIHPIGNPVIGVKRISDSGGAGSWVWIDENDNTVEVETGYFDKHPTYQFQEVDLCGNEMVAIPKFYVKSDSGGRFWISPTPREGFHVHPAFMSRGKELSFTVTNINDEEIDDTSIMIGKWQSWIDFYGIIDESRKMYSMPHWSDDRIEALAQEKTGGLSDDERTALRNIYPSVNASYWQNWHAADAWNDHDPDGAVNVVGFHMMNVWEWSALQWLALIEARTTDVQSVFGLGHVNGSQLDKVDGKNNMSANFHGIYGLWGNVWQWIQGVQTYYNGTLYIWDNIGNKVWKNTKKTVPLRSGDYELWSPGETCGYWKERILTSGYNFDTSDLFIPDAGSLVSSYSRGSWSDGVWGRTRSNSKDLYACAVGGSFDSGDWGGLFGWNFNVRLGNEITVNELTEEEIVWDYYNVASRLCFSPVNLTPSPDNEDMLDIGDVNG